MPIMWTYVGLHIRQTLIAMHIMLESSEKLLASCIFLAAFYSIFAVYCCCFFLLATKTLQRLWMMIFFFASWQPLTTKPCILILIIDGTQTIIVKIFASFKLFFSFLLYSMMVFLRCFFFFHSWVMFYMTHHDVGSRRKDCYDRFFFSPVVAAANDRIAILLNAHRTADVMENAFLLFYFWFLDEKKNPWIL